MVREISTPAMKFEVMNNCRTLL